MTAKKLKVIALTLAITACVGPWALALINPNFTPIHLVRDAQTILLLEFKTTKDGVSRATVSKVLKGKYEKKELVVDLTRSAVKLQARQIANMTTKDSSKTAILFIGRFDPSGGADEGPEQMAEGPEQMAEGPDEADGPLAGLLHLGGTWVILSQGKPAWEFNNIDSKMQETWRGGTDMLIRCCRYILANTSSDVPVESGVEWGEALEVATLKGRVNDAYPVTMDETGKLKLYLASDSGDKLYAYDGDAEEFKDITAERKLTAKSRISTWNDFDRNSKADLVSWNGEDLMLYAQGLDGTLAAGKKLLGKAALGGDCLSLTSVDYTGKGSPGLIVGTPQGPVLVKANAQGKAQPLFSAKPDAALGAAGCCLVADLNADAIPDVLHLFVNGSMLYKGIAAGQWARPVKCAAALGPKPNGAFLADFDADGHSDVVTFGQHELGLGIWQNTGDSKFIERKGQSGESYNAGKGIGKAMLGDINNDGRQDFVAFYSDQLVEPKDPQVFFNRGFRSFGLAADLNLANNNILPDAVDGQQTGCWGDFNHDGALDLVVIDGNNALGVVLRHSDDEARCLRVTLPTKAAYAGPVNVTAFSGKRNLGTWRVTPCVSEAIIGAVKPGTFVIKWQFPGGELKSQTVVLEEGSARYALSPDSLKKME